MSRPPIFARLLLDPTRGQFLMIRDTEEGRPAVRLIHHTGEGMMTITLTYHTESARDRTFDNATTDQLIALFNDLNPTTGKFDA